MTRQGKALCVLGAASATILTYTIVDIHYRLRLHREWLRDLTTDLCLQRRETRHPAEADRDVLSWRPSENEHPEFTR